MAQKERFTDFKNRIGTLKVDELMKRFPETKPALYNHFGASCFECPASSEEEVALAIRVHDSLEVEFYKDLAETLEIELDETPDR